MFVVDISSLNESVGESVILLSVTGVQPAEHSFTKCSNLTRSLIPAWVIPQGTEYLKIQISRALSGCSPRTVQPLWIAGKEIKVCALPIHISSTETKKGPLQPYCMLCRLALSASPHGLLVCLLSPPAQPFYHMFGNKTNQIAPPGWIRCQMSKRMRGGRLNLTRVGAQEGNWVGFLRATVPKQSDRWDCVDKKGW